MSSQKKKTQYDSHEESNTAEDSVVENCTASVSLGVMNTVAHWKVLVFGQCLSVAVSMIWASQATLYLKCAWSAPAFSSSWHYLVVSLNIIPLALLGRRIRMGKDLTVPSHWFCGLPLKASPWYYLGMAFLSVQGNYCNLTAIRYTTVTSVSLFDAMAIPATIILSYLFLGRRYRRAHMVGVSLCISGILLNVMVDYFSDKLATVSSPASVAAKVEVSGDEPDDGALEYPDKVVGDFLACLGGVLYGLNDVLAEMAVREFGGVTEYLAMVGLFGCIISWSQCALFEKHLIDGFFQGKLLTDCSTAVTYALFVSFAFGQALRKMGLAHFLSLSEAALLNLSLLTSDLYTALFSIFVEHILPRPLFWMAMVMVLSGIFVYEIGPSPIVQKKQQMDIFPIDVHLSVHGSKETGAVEEGTQTLDNSEREKGL